MCVCVCACVFLSSIVIEEQKNAVLNDVCPATWNACETDPVETGQRWVLGRRSLPVVVAVFISEVPSIRYENHSAFVCCVRMFLKMTGRWCRGTRVEVEVGFVGGE